MGVVDFILRRKSVFDLRRDYDRLREKADQIENDEKRLAVLRILDSIEPSIAMLEEHYVSSYEKRRIFERIMDGMSDAKRVVRDEQSFKPMIRQKRDV